MIIRTTKKSGTHIKGLIILVLLMAAMLSVSCSGQPETQQERVDITYFYYSVCSSCDAETEFIDSFEDITGISVNTPNLYIEMYNTAEETGLSKWNDTAVKYNLSKDDYVIPVLKINDEFMQINEIDEVITTDVKDVVYNLENAIGVDSSIIVYFSSPGCHDCDVAYKDTISKLAKSVKADGLDSDVQIIEVSISDKNGPQMFDTYCSEYNVPQEKRKAPIVFIGYKYYSGVQEIESMTDAVKAGDGLKTPIFNPTEQNNDSSLLSGFGIIGVLVTGFINGLNPCSISMFLMLLSLITLKTKRILKIGFSFAAGKFVGFFVLGTLLYSIIDKINFAGVQLFAGIILCVFSVLMIGLNLYDYVLAKKEKYGDIKLQLPKGFRAVNHKLLKENVGDTSGIIVGFLLGLIISGGEFLCTGQIYLATIVNSIHSGVERSLAVIYLLVYSFAFVLPLIILVIVAASGKRIFNLTEFFRKNMHIVKLINAIIFVIVLILAIIMIF